MNNDAIWQVVDAQRLGVAALLEQLSDDEWRAPSLCAGWTVRDVAGHLAWQQRSSLGAVVVDLIRARGRLDRMIHDASHRYAARPPEQLIAEIRGLVGTRRHAPGITDLEVLIDILVHPQDIAVALGRHHEMPAAAAAVAATRVWQLGKPFHAAERLHGYRLAATDTTWSIGDGRAVEGPMDAILLLLTGRNAAASRLSGEAAATLTASLSARPN
jgi:uncharacterized protein (TIGR03083 family)